MAKDSKSKKTTNYYGCVYGGVMKQGYVYFFSTTEDPEDYFNQFKDYYGNKVRGRFVKAADDEDYLEKVQDKLSEHQVFEKLYEVSVDTASKTLKELTGAKKTSLLGEDESNQDDEKTAKTETDKKSKSKKASQDDDDDDDEVESKKVKVSSKSKKVEETKSKSSKKTKAVESEDESSDDEQPSEAESESESEPEEVKKPSKTSSKKKETKSKSSK